MNPTQSCPRPKDFLLENLKMQTNIIELSFLNNVKRLIFLGSSCIYPLNAANPISEDSFMDGKLEPTNSPYSMAKLYSLEFAKTMKEQFGHKILNIIILLK